MSDDSNPLAWMSPLADLASAVTAAVALWIAYRSIRLNSRSVETQERSLAAQEQHNRLSVKPVPFLAMADYEHLIRAKVINNGAGPLMVKSVRVIGAGKSETDVISWMPALPEGIFWTSFTSLLEDRGVLPGHELILINLEGDPDDPRFATFRDQCRHVLSELHVFVEYTDIYGTMFEPYQRKMNWFARDKGTRSKTSAQLS